MIKQNIHEIVLIIRMLQAICQIFSSIAHRVEYRNKPHGSYCENVFFQSVAHCLAHQAGNDCYRSPCIIISSKNHVIEMHPILGNNLDFIFKVQDVFRSNLLHCTKDTILFYSPCHVQFAKKICLEPSKSFSFRERNKVSLL